MHLQYMIINSMVIACEPGQHLAIGIKQLHEEEVKPQQLLLIYCMETTYIAIR